MKLESDSMEEFYSEFYVEATHNSEQGRQGISDRLYQRKEIAALSVHIASNRVGDRTSEEFS